MTDHALRYQSPSIDLSSETRICSLSSRTNETISIVHTMPLEALSRIFKFVIEDSEGFLVIVPFPKLIPLSVLAQVCSGWRKVAMSTPSLLSSICINLHGIGRDDLLYLSNILTRSKQTQLRVRIENAGPLLTRYYPITELGVHAFLPIISNSQRITTFECFLDRWDWEGLERDFMNSPIGNSLRVACETMKFPSLRSFINRYPVDDAPGYHHWIWTNLVFPAPLLSTIYLCNLITPLSENRLPWNRITHLTIGFVQNPEILVEIIEIGPLLRSITVYEIDSEDVFISPPRQTPVVSLKLESLHIRFRSLEEIAHVFGRVTLPRLEELTLHGLHRPSDLQQRLIAETWPKSILDMLTRSSFCITTLILAIEISQQACEAILQRTPLLTAFQLTSFTNVASGINSLYRTKGSVVPNLRTISLVQLDEPLSFSDVNTLVSFAKYKCSADSSLDFVEFADNRKGNGRELFLQSWREDIENLRRQGTFVEYSYVQDPNYSVL